MSVSLGILLALASAIAANLGSLLKHRGCSGAHTVDLRHPVRSAVALWSQRWFAGGMALGGVAWVLHVGAISLAPLSLVQMVLAGGVVLIAVMADRLFGLPVGARQRWGLALTAAGLILFAASTPASGSDNHSFALAPMAAFEAGLFAAGIVFLVGPRSGVPAEHHGILLAASAGLLFGVCNVAIKALTGLVGHAGPAALVSPWTVVAAAASFLAFFASARSLQIGGAVETIAVTGTAANIAVIAGGIVVFADPVADDALGVAAQACGFLLVITAAALMPAPSATSALRPAAERS